MNPHYQQTEFEIQATAWFILSQKYKYVRGELPYKNKNRFDIIIFDGNKRPALVIEVKKPTVNIKTANAQVIRYNELTSAPVMTINQMHQAQDIINFIDSYSKHYNITLNLVENKRE